MKLRFGRTAVLVSTVLALSLSSVEPAVSVDLKVAAKSTVRAFQDLAKNILDQKNTREDEHTKNRAEIDQELLSTVSKASTTQQIDLSAVASFYNPKISASNEALAGAKAKWETVNTLVIKDSYGFMGSAQSFATKYFLCPPSTLPNGAGWMEIVKRNCNGSQNPMLGARSTKTTVPNTIGGEDWQKGDVGTLNTWDLPTEAQSVITDGYIVPTNPTLFDSIRLTIRNEMNNVNSLMKSSATAKANAQTKYDNTVQAAKDSANKAIQFENNRYEEEFEKLELSQLEAEMFILAAKRASKDYKTFGKAFETALKFEHNRAELNRLAEMPWSGITGLRALNTLTKVIALADLADEISMKYTFVTAAKINASVGNTFTKDSAFTASLKLGRSIYVKTIKS
jgi:DNA-directed RNA polymerase subunit K/omega